jgi:chromosome segregation ATPase
MPDTHNVEEQPKRAKAYGDLRQTAGDKADGSLEEQLTEAQNKLNEATRTIAQQQSILRDLQAAVTDAQQALSGFDETLQKRLDGEKKDLGDRQGIAEKELTGDQPQKIKDIASGFNAEIDKKKQAAKDAEKASGDATSAANDDSHVKDAQHAVDEEKKLPKTIDGTLQTVKAMLELATKALNQKDYVSAYFLAWDGQEQLKSAQDKDGDWHGPIPTAEQYNAEIHKREQALFEAKQDLAKKKEAAVAALKDYTEKQQAYDAARKSRQADILSAIKAVPTDKTTDKTEAA